VTAGAQARQTFVRLLDLEPGLAARLREDDRAEARERLRLRTVELREGEWSLDAEDRRLHPFGLIVVDGLLLQEVQLGGRRSHQLLGRGDVVLPGAGDDGSLPIASRLVVASPGRVALFDDRLQTPFSYWPGLALGLVERLGAQLARASAQAAIAQLPRVDDRLEATFWDLADRWGRVTPAGIHIPLKLTHEALARIVGGRRPTITLALSRLAERGVVTRRADGSWLMTATAPTLPANEQADAPMPVAVPLDRGQDDDDVVPRSPVWSPQLREELLAAARRAREEHMLAAERAAAEQRRYEETRERARALVAEARRTREARARRGGRADGAVIPPPPPGP
jgi:CRP/FNR family transcriptional regulator, cyclic AMP receptor protein